MDQWVRESRGLFGYALDRALSRASKENGFKREDVAVSLGTNRMTLYNWTSGAAVPDAKTLERLFSSLSGLHEDLERFKDLPVDQPIQEDVCTELWRLKASHELNKILHDYNWAWADDWPRGFGVDEVDLVYEDAVMYDEHTIMPKRAVKVLEEWERMYPAKSRQYRDEAEQGWGTQARLESVTLRHPKPRYQIRISKSRFLFYLAIQARLDKRECELIKLRNECFNNALHGIRNGERLGLPSVFAVHMAVVAEGGRKAMLCKRPDSTPMFPGAWQFGIGEMMHGPCIKEFPHFSEGLPNLDLFLRNAVAEELNYQDAKAGDFKLHGFAIEYASLAPKLIVVYRSDADAGSLRMKARAASDPQAEVRFLDLTPLAVATAMREYPRWAPTSKLALMLALLDTETSDQGREELKRTVERMMS
jgi:transcriptional regulator with XRE-family HTH domain